jgi:multiple sugar transport system substrate-binding protein
MEYYMAGKPAYDRATSGWGVPSVKKYLKDMPQGTPYYCNDGLSDQW